MIDIKNYFIFMTTCTFLLIITSGIMRNDLLYYNEVEYKFNKVYKNSNYVVIILNSTVIVDEVSYPDEYYSEIIKSDTIKCYKKDLKIISWRSYKTQLDIVSAIFIISTCVFGFCFMCTMTIISLRNPPNEIQNLSEDDEIIN